MYVIWYVWFIDVQFFSTISFFLLVPFITPPIIKTFLFKIILIYFYRINYILIFIVN